MQDPQEKEEEKGGLIKRIWPVLTSLGGAVVMILAFLLPSIQEQWDRYNARKVIQEYVRLGDGLFRDEHYKLAEDAYTKAFELSEKNRLDIEMKRLDAKINQINEDPEWGSSPPEGLQEVDFQVLLHMQSGKGMEKQRVATLNCYGIFLASLKRVKDARAAFEEAIRLVPADPLSYVNLGSLLDQQGDKDAAEKAYRKALSIEPENAQAHYNLGLLLLELGKLTEARKELGEAVRLDPDDKNAQNEYDVLVKRIGR